MEWLGYKGRKQADKQNDFIKLLDSLKVKQQNERREELEPVIVERKDLVKQLLEVTNAPKKDIWTKIKEFTGWTNSKLAIDEGTFQYKIKY
jgi:hypothetical protein